MPVFVLLFTSAPGTGGRRGRTCHHDYRLEATIPPDLGRHRRACRRGGGCRPVEPGSGGGLRRHGDPPGPDLLRHLLLEVRRDRPRPRREALEDRGQSGRPAEPGPALPAGDGRRRRAFRPRSPQGAPAPPAEARPGGMDGGHLGPGPRRRRREAPEDQGGARSRSRGGVLARHRRHLPEAHAARVRDAEHGRPVVRPVPRTARRRVRADLRGGSGLARAHRHPQCALPRADRLAPRREHAQHSGAGVRGGRGLGGVDHRRRPALLRGRRQGDALPAHQAGRRSRAGARLDERPGVRGAVRQGVCRRPRLRLRRVCGRDRRRHPRVGVSRDGHRARGHSRDGTRDGQAPSRHARSPGPPRHLVRRRRAAEPRDRAVERAARQLGPQGRLLEARPDDRARLPVSAVPAVGKREGGQPQRKIQVRQRVADHGDSRGDHHRPAVSDQGLVRLRDQPDPRHARSARDDPRHPGPRSSRRGRRDPRGDRRVGRRGAAGSHVSRTPRRPERGVVPRAVRGAAPACRPRAPLPEAELVDRPPAGAQARARRLLSLDDDRGIPAAPVEQGGPQLRDAEDEGDHPRREAARVLRGRRAAGVPDGVREDRVLLDAAARSRLRPRSEVPGGRSRRPRARSGCCSAARRCTRSAARSPTRSSTTGCPRTRSG